MNVYRFLAYLLLVIIAVLVAALGAMLYKVAGGVPLTPEIRRALLVLVVVLLIAILVLIFLLCLARAKDRLKERRRTYRKLGSEAELRSTGLENICDVLVRRKFPRPCLELPIKITRRPDPNIYSQFFLMAQGLPVTWDNPDVTIALGGVEQDTFNLAPSTNYQVTVAHKNASPFFNANNTQVQVNLLEFGVGGPVASPITTYSLNIPAGTISPGVPRTFNWTSPGTPGHYCIQVLLAHPDDVNVGNNEGWNNTVVQGVGAGARVAFPIPVWNRFAQARKGQQERGDRTERVDRSRVRLTLDSYELPRATTAHGDPELLFTPRPALWGAVLEPAELQVGPGDPAGSATLRLNVPVGTPPGTRAAFNVSATAGETPLGGVTIYLDVR